MAPKKNAVSFDAIIKSDREKKQNEQLASQLLGKERKNRRASAPGPGAVQKGPASKPGSLASRIGVPKRSASLSSRTNTTKPAHPAPVRSHSTSLLKPSTKPQKPLNSAQKRRANPERLASAIKSGHSQANIREPSTGLSIKGASGPFVVEGGNFAPGTTAADIQSALEPVSGPMLSCRVIAHSPTVTAEFAFADKWTAENVVANYHNQRADGRLLTMQLKPPKTNTQLTHSQKAFNDIREQANRDRNKRRSQKGVQDGNYGFNEAEGTGRLYSDEMNLDRPHGAPRRPRHH